MSRADRMEMIPLETFRGAEGGATAAGRQNLFPLRAAVRYVVGMSNHHRGIFIGGELPHPSDRQTRRSRVDIQICALSNDGLAKST